LNRLTRIWKQYVEWVNNTHKGTAINWAISGVCATCTLLSFLSKQPIDLVTFVLSVVVALSASVMWFRSYVHWQLHKEETIENKQ